MENPRGISIFNVTEKWNGWNGISIEWIAWNFHSFHWQCNHSNGKWKFHAIHSMEIPFHRSGYIANGISTPVEFPFHYAIKIFWSPMESTPVETLFLACVMPKIIWHKIPMQLLYCFILFLFVLLIVALPYAIIK